MTGIAGTDSVLNSITSANLEMERELADMDALEARRSSAKSNSDGNGSSSWYTNYESLSDRDFQRLSAFIKERTGISVPEIKKTMVQARLQKRLRALQMRDFSEYCTYLFSPECDREEISSFINVITTNKTDFFREPHHFKYLTASAVPYLRKHGLIQTHEFKVWSAGCSTGMEPYTIAMTLAEYEEESRGLSWSILGTDVSTSVLEKAVRAVYREDDIEPVPMPLRKKYLLRSTDRRARLVKVSPEIRSRVDFQHLNFMDKYYDLRSKFEVIFCRNALIYFDRPTEFEILKKLTSYLVPGGFLFLGHSESLNGFPLPFTPVGPTIYQKATR